jgi:hypothetical protein
MFHGSFEATKAMPVVTATMPTSQRQPPPR